MMITRGVKFFFLSFIVCFSGLVGSVVAMKPEKLTNYVSHVELPDINVASLNPLEYLPYKAVTRVVSNEYNTFTHAGQRYASAMAASVRSVTDGVVLNVMNGVRVVQESVETASLSVSDAVSQTSDGFAMTIQNQKDLFLDSIDNMVMSLDHQDAVRTSQPYDVVQNDLIMTDAIDFNNIEPAVGIDESSEEPPESMHEYVAEEMTMVAEAVLVPRAKTVISSSRDGKIKKIYFDNGDIFKKGDILLEYRCHAVRAEIDAAVAQKRFAREKTLTTKRLFDLDLISKVEKLESHFENKRADASKAASQSKYSDCIVKADYNGRVVKRLANAGEYTRTDRVLMEVASEGTLDAEFLLPSIWLRWVNVGAPLRFVINETGKEYSGTIKRIYGEVDPVSQSIQIRAEMDDYEHPLLPGMSGEVIVEIDKIRSAGIQGFLETGTE